ncbi:MAG: crotonase/enoyl-CoA hydratase family protein [Acidimicrobiales bacterium]
MDALVDYQLKDSVATVTMDDGKVNVLSPPMLAELNGALDRAAADGVPVLLTGRAGVFSAGFDLRILNAGGADAREMLRVGFETAERLLSFPTPVVIACNGHALAMGVFLLLSGDYRVGAAGDHKIGANEVAVGLTMPAFGVEMCRQRLGPSHFHRAVINAEIFPPDEAVTAGFLDRVVPAADLQDVAFSKATELGRLDPKVHAATKLRARDQALKAVRAAIEADRSVPTAAT